MDQKQIGQIGWFRGAVGVLTLLSGIALFAVAGMGVHTVVSALIAFLCLMGLERVFSGLLVWVVVLVRSRSANRP